MEIEKFERRKRKFFPEDFKPTDREILKNIFDELLKTEFKTKDDLIVYIEKFSELANIITEEYVWRYIKMTCFADKEEYRQAFQQFNTEILSLTMEYEFKIKKKFYDSPLRSQLDQHKFSHLDRIISNSIEIFREENIPLMVKESLLANKYGETISKLVITFRGEEKTFSQMNVFLKDPDRKTREEAWKAKYAKLQEVSDSLDSLFDDLREIRNAQAKNAGYSNYRDYKHIEKGRFSYSVEDVLKFHDTIEKVVIPIVREIYRDKRDKLIVDTLRPWDTTAETDGRVLKPFSNVEEFAEKSIRILSDVKESFGKNLQRMKASGFLDLENRKGKAPGGYNFGLPEMGSSFIFMNAVGLNADVRTLLHESGHAMHSNLTSDISNYYYKDYPTEVAELASMSMELFTADKLIYFYPEERDFRKAKRELIEGTITFLPWCMTVDAFQHWVYTSEHTASERREQFKKVMDRFNAGVDWSGLEEIEKIMWMQQLHIFEVPFYYIEYGIAQLGALAMYKNYKKDPVRTVENYENFLKLGYSKSIPELYSAAGIEFSFSEEYVKGIVDFVKGELESLA